MSTSIRTVVVAVGAVEGDTVLPAGVDLANRLSASLHVVHSYEIPHAIQAAYVRLGMREATVHRLFGERLRARLEAEVARLGGGEATVHSVAEEPGRAICDLAGDVGADLIVLGATRLGVLTTHILGSTADRVIRGARLPVLVLRPPFTSSFPHVMITTDLSPASAAVVRRGVELVDQLTGGEQPQLRCVLAAFYDTALPQPVPRNRLADGAKRELEDFLAKAVPPELQVESVIRIGDPAREVVADAASKPTDLVVLGTHGRTGVSRYFLGSVAGSILRSISTSVLVIPHASLERTPDAASPDTTAGTVSS